MPVGRKIFVTWSPLPSGRLCRPPRSRRRAPSGTPCRSRECFPRARATRARARCRDGSRCRRACRRARDVSGHAVREGRVLHGHDGLVPIVRRRPSRALPSYGARPRQPRDSTAAKSTRARRRAGRARRAAFAMTSARDLATSKRRALPPSGRRAACAAPRLGVVTAIRVPVSRASRRRPTPRRLARFDVKSESAPTSPS